MNRWLRMCAFFLMSLFYPPTGGSSSCNDISSDLSLFTALMSSRIAGSWSDFITHLVSPARLISLHAASTAYPSSPFAGTTLVDTHSTPLSNELNVGNDPFFSSDSCHLNSRKI